MVEKIRLGGEWDMKKWVAAVLFGAIIIVFAFWGVRPATMDDSAGGAAAVVNDHQISVAEFRNLSEQAEQNMKGQLEQLPEVQRRAYRQDLHRRVLEHLVRTEAVYQAASKRGVTASDAEVKEQILAIPFLQENGRFMGDRYRQWLQNMNMSAEDFETRIRKDIVTQKLQELFVGSSAPTREEMRRNRALANQKVAMKFVQISKDELKKMDTISDQEVAAYITQHKKEIAAYYADNKVDYTKPDKYHARDILIRIDEKRPEADAMKMAADLRKQLTPKNFAAMASKNSEDPGAKSKGGDLGERQTGSLLGEFEDAVLALKPGEISQPVKVQGGVHLILLESRVAGGTTPLEKAEPEVARHMIGRTREDAVVNKLKAAVEKGDRKETDAMLAKAGVKWTDAGDVDMATRAIPKLGDAKDVMPAVIRQGRKGGLVKQLIPFNGNYVIVDVANWKETPVAKEEPEVEGMDRMMAYRKAEGTFDSWAQEVRLRANVQTNPRLLQ